VAGGAVTGVTVNASGSGYGEYARLMFAGGSGNAGYGAMATAQLSGGAITSVSMVTGGAGYNAIPLVTVAPYMNAVYSTIPLVFSDTPPFMFFYYVEGTSRPLAYGLSEVLDRNYIINAFACQALAQEVAQADQMSEEFIGVFHDLIWRDRTLGGVVSDTYIEHESFSTFETKPSASGGQKFMADVFRIHISASAPAQPS
jgi:hypothetical protein